jgi:glutamyl-Q tRNA(Asp) synthetase
MDRHLPDWIKIVTSSQPVFRFAPSPNGFLHLGHALSALLNAELAQRFGGRLLLRIEDIDRERTREDYCRAIVEDLAWLGLSFEPEIRRQSDHLDDDLRATRHLIARGLVYSCQCSRGDIARRGAALTSPGTDWPRDPDGGLLYPGTCKHSPPDGSQPVAMRLDMEACLAEMRGITPSGLTWNRFDPGSGRMSAVVADPARWGDTVVIRKDIPTSYHLAVVLDDAAQGVTHVVRGQDLEAATDLHRLLQHLLGLPPPVYYHHPLIRDEAGEKLAKSRLSKPLRQWRAEGASPADLRRMTGVDALLSRST